MRDDGFLFSDGKGGCWQTAVQTNAMKEYTTQWAGFECTSQMYRHIAKAINREFIRGYIPDIGWDDDEQMNNAQMAAHDLAQGHGLRITNTHYGLTSDMIEGLNPFTENLYRNVCNGCQFFFKLESKLSRPAILKGIEEHINLSTAYKCQKVLYELFGNEAKWRSNAQEQAVQAIVEGESPVIVILPTAGGKSLCIWLPVKLDEEGKITIVVVPLVELARDIIKGCQKNGISAIHWQSEEDRLAKVIIVTVNKHNSPEFHRIAANLHRTGSLSRLIYDEIHFCLTSSDFRPEMDDIWRLNLPVQIIGLTATQPIASENDLKDAMILPDAKFIRTSTNRSNIQYSVYRMHHDQSEEQFIIEQVKLCLQMMEKEEKKRKVLIYARHVKICERLSIKLDGLLYHKDLSEKQANLQAWKEGVKLVMCATAALGAGFNPKDLYLVIHCGLPWGFSDYIQESGRVGRDGEEGVESVIVLSDRDYVKLEMQNPDTLPPEQRYMRAFILEEDCRRKISTEYFDGEIQTCQQSESVWCDRCKIRLAHTEEGQRKRAVEESTQHERAKRAKYAERVTAQETAIRINGERKTKINQIIMKLQGHCPVCWLSDGEKGWNHRFEHCQVLYLALERPWKSVKFDFQERFVACFKWKRVCDWCPEFLQAKETGINQCSLEDVVFPMVVASYIMKSGMAEKIAKRKFVDIDDLTSWMTQGSRLLGAKCINAFKVFEALIFNK